MSIDQGVSLEVQLAASLRAIDGHMTRQETRLAQMCSAIYPVEIPAGVAKVVSAGVLIGSAELFGPREGNHWDVRRVTVNGLSASDTVTLYRVSSPVSQSAIAENEITPLTAGTADIDPVYSPGLGACMLRPGQSLMVYAASGLTATGNITVTWDGINVADAWLGLYLL